MGPGKYDIERYLENIEVDKNTGTAPFMNPVGRAIEKIDPYDPLKPMKKHVDPGPGQYNTEELKTIKKKTERAIDILNGVPQLTANFITENTDRFGLPIHDKTVKPPGPGLKYSIPYSYLSEIGGVLEQAPREKRI